MEPAFPYDEKMGSGSHWQSHPGMTLRDWFAGQAMAAIIAKIPFQKFPEYFSPCEKTSIVAYDYADAMLATRSGTAS